MIRKTVLLIIGLVFLVSAVSAKAPIVSNGIECGVLAPDGIGIFVITGTEVTKVDNKITLTCKGMLPADIPSPDRAVHFDYAGTGILYDNSFGLTEDWREVITPSGQVILKASVSLKLKP